MLVLQLWHVMITSIPFDYVGSSSCVGGRGRDHRVAGLSAFGVHALASTDIQKGRENERNPRYLVFGHLVYILSY